MPKIEFTLFNNPIYLVWPQSLVGWLGWLTFLGIIALLLWRGWKFNHPWQRLERITFTALLILIPLTSLFLVVQLPPDQALPPPGQPIDPLGPALLVFAALPWILAAGLLGPAPAAGLAFLSGLLLALWNTHSLFTPLEMALLATLYGNAMQQRYRLRMFAMLRRPLAAAVVLGVLYPVVSMISDVCLVSGTLANRLDYAITHLPAATLVLAVELVLASIFAEGIALSFPQIWGGRGALQPAPLERRLHVRFLYNLAPLAIVLVLALMVGDWVVAGNAAQQMLRDRMAGTAQTAAQTIPFFLASGQNLLQQMATDERLSTAAPETLASLLEQDLRSVPFFRQLFILDRDGLTVAGYPLTDYNRSGPTPEELMGIELAFNGVKGQTYTASPAEGGTTAQISFLTPIMNGQGEISALLIGRSDLASNPFMEPVLDNLNSMKDFGGQGLLIDDKQRILYTSSQDRLLDLYQGTTGGQSLFYEANAADGTRRLVYYQPALGNPWGVVLEIPARQAQQLALTIAAPLLVMLVVLFLIAVILLRLGLRVVTGSLQNLATQADLISSGQLDHPLPVMGEDEVGQLGRSFERMRVSLKDRLDELNRLLLVSQGVASSLDIEQSAQPVLDSALVLGASSARMVLENASGAIEQTSTSLTRFGLGPANELYRELDEQILELTRHQDRVVLTNISRVRVLTLTPGGPRPEALLALALHHEDLFFGTLWLAYDQPHTFSEDELRFITTLAGQAALAAANARLFLTAEIGRQRLAAILASTPDPVLVTDHQNRLLLANPAAWQSLGLRVEAGDGQPIDKVTTQTELIKLLRSTDEKLSIEIKLPDARIYLATASSVMAEGRRVGRVCVLRDVTHFKELDALKSEFVSTVSHDLRSPLTLMRGYATMLEMVGDLNEQQTGYVRKIVTSVETMSRLVNTLLDLNRIEAGIDLVLEMVPIHDIIDRVTGALQLQATQKRVTLISELPPHTVPLIEADQALLQQALHNLVENAIKYTEPGGKVTLRVVARQDRMVFEVNDTGIGIGPVDIPRLFEKFYRAGHDKAKKQSGTGLGLAIVKSIAERHGGSVWVESQLGKGSTFSLAIPLRRPKRDEKGVARPETTPHEVVRKLPS